MFACLEAYIIIIRLFRFALRAAQIGIQDLHLLIIRRFTVNIMIAFLREENLIHSLVSFDHDFIRISWQNIRPRIFVTCGIKIC
jgi:hypothetical protein